jgi:hypothetical protein
MLFAKKKWLQKLLCNLPSPVRNWLTVNPVRKGKAAQIPYFCIIYQKLSIYYANINLLVSTYKEL